MKPELLTLALSTPLEHLLPLPNGVRIALWLKEAVERFDERQLLELLTWIDARIEDAVALDQTGAQRDDERDLDWLMRAFDNHEVFALSDGTPFGFRDIYRVLALHKLGTVIDGADGLPAGALVEPLISALMESQEAMLLADLLPEVDSTESMVDAAWREGMAPPSLAEIAAGKATTHASKNLNDGLHAKNREAKRLGLELYFSKTYATDELAYRVIGEKVSRSPGTVRNWIVEAKQKRRRP
jgi:hypothetical protein